VTSDLLVDPGPTLVRRGALVVGVTFLLVGALGFVPGLTTGVRDIHIAGHGSGTYLFGLFQVSVLHNVLHLLFGLAGLLASRTPGGARGYLLYGGAAYLGLFAYGLVVGQDSAANLVPLNPADDVLHLFLGVTMIVLGLGLSHPALRRAGNPDEANG